VSFAKDFGPNPELKVSANKNYVIFKSSFENAMYLVPSCDPLTKYNRETNTCDRCLHSAFTYGVQDTKCLLCS